MNKQPKFLSPYFIYPALGLLFLVPVFSSYLLLITAAILLVIGIVLRDKEGKEEKKRQAATALEEEQQKVVPDVREVDSMQKSPEPLVDPLEYIQKINSLNDQIADSKVSNSLYQTSSLILQIIEMQKKVPECETKITKLWKVYIPYLIKTLEDFSKVDSATANSNYAIHRDRLVTVIDTINDGMDSLLEDMQNSGFDNLATDISTLSNLLQSDGFSSNTLSSMLQQKKGNSNTQQ